MPADDDPSEEENSAQTAKTIDNRKKCSNIHNTEAPVKLTSKPSRVVRTKTKRLETVTKTTSTKEDASPDDDSAEDENTVKSAIVGKTSSTFRSN